jgi:hypothetical protein
LGVVIVDEGHYEPAPSWAKAVRDLKRPTILFTATPYRNDFKFFDVDLEFCFFYSHEQAEADRLIRGVKFEPREFDSVPAFGAELLAFWQQLSASPKPRVIVRCATKNSVQSVTDYLAQQGLQVIGIHERFEAASGNLLRREVPNPEEENAEFWVHQNKMIEGIDDPTFRLVAFFEPFSSERAFVQQVGRVLRNPGKKARQYAWIFHDPRQALEESWSAYRYYDTVAEPRLLLQSPRDFAMIQPPTQYVTGRFRQQLDITRPDVHLDFDYPRTARVFVLPNDFSLDLLAEAIEKEWNEYDFDLQPVIEPETSTRVHPYIAVRISPLLLRKAFAEYEVAVTIYRQIHDFLFFYDSQGKTPEALLPLPRVETRALQRLYAGTEARLTSVSLLNTNLGRHSSRRRLVQAQSIEELGPDLADHAQLVSTTTGLTEGSGWTANPTFSRYVGFSKGRITDRSGGTTPFDDYMRWIEYIADSLNDSEHQPLQVFDRYAEIVQAPADPSPTNILLDFEQEIFDGYVGGTRQTLSIADLCLPVVEGAFRCDTNGTSHDVAVAWDGATRTYRLSCPSLDQMFAMKRTLGNRQAETLVGFLNREQAFRIIPESAETDFTIYAGGRFCRPRLPLWGRAVSNRFELLQILHPIPQLAAISSEKGGPASATEAGWASGSLFALIDGVGIGTEMEPLFGGVGLLVCDDMGTEIADFIAFDESNHRVIAIHAKAFPQGRPLSASALHEVSAQALKNLGYLQPYFVGEPKNLNRWNRPWTGREGRVKSRIRRGDVTGREAWKRMRAALLDPQTSREVWLVLGQGLSKTSLETARRKVNPPPEVVQLIYSLQGSWGAISSVGARLHVYCSP